MVFAREHVSREPATIAAWCALQILQGHYLQGPTLGLDFSNGEVVQLVRTLPLESHTATADSVPSRVACKSSQSQYELDHP